MNKLIFLYIFIFQFFLISTDDKTEDDNKDYFGLILKIIKGLEKKCFPELEKIFDKEKDQPESNKSYPWIGDAIGKNLNDIGDELECVKSIPNTIFIMVNIYQINLTKTIQTIDDDFLNYLEIKNFTIGFCLMSECKTTIIRYMTLLTKYLLKNMTDGNHISFLENDRFENTTNNVAFFENHTKNTRTAYLIIILVFSLLKVVGAFLRLIFIHKGYDKYMVEKINKEKIDFNSKDKDLEQDIEEKINLTQKAITNIEPMIKEEGYSKEYNPLYDFSEKLPWYLKLLKFFDLFDDLYIISSKRNKYYNDTGLDVINFNRATVICALVFSRTYSTLITLPSEEIMNKAFFGSWFNIFFRLSKNCYVCWIYLEGAYTTYKLLCFISSEMFRYYAKEGKSSVNFYAKLPIIYGKFLILLIPRILEFFGVYFIYYYRVGDYNYFTDAKATFVHIVNHLLAKDIKCDTFGSLFKLFKSIFSLDVKDLTCYKFTHIYINMFICILFTMVLLFIFFLIKQQIVELILLIANIIYMFVIVNQIKDPKKNEDKFLESHMEGQKFTSTIFASFFSVYNLGLFTGIILFNYNKPKNIIQKLIYENYAKYFTKINEISKIDLDDESDAPEKDNKNQLIQHRTKSIESAESSQNNESILSRSQTSMSDINSDEYNLPYYPLLIINKLMKWLYERSFLTKLLSILACVIILILIDLALIIYLKVHLKTEKKDGNFNIPLNDVAKFFYANEKILFIFVYFILNILMIVMPKKGILRDLMNTKIAITLSRMGFLMVCIVYSSTYLAFVIFYLRIKLYVPTFFVISIGNLLLMVLEVLIIYTLMELSFAIVIKRILRLGRD